MTTTRSRFAPKQPAAAPSGAAPAGPTLAEALADRDIALVRIRCRYNQAQTKYHDLAAFTSSYRRIFFDLADHDVDQTIRAGLIAWYQSLHPDVDWSQDHQVHLVDGTVSLAPEAWEDGFIPEDDLSFGQSRPAVYIAAGTSWAEQVPAFPFPPMATAGAER